MTESIAQLPEDFQNLLNQILDERQKATVLDSFQKTKAFYVHLNPLRQAPQETLCQLKADGFTLIPVENYPNAFKVPYLERSGMTHHPYAESGIIYLQNLSSMVAPALLAPKPGETVLDLAAAPGGKTLQLATFMDNQGQLSAVEPVKKRFFKLKENLSRCGVEIAKCYMTDGRTVGYKCPERFDKVLLDAPCSSEARFDLNDPQSMSHWSMRKVKECSRKQMKLIEAAFHSLKPGGVLVYSTCSFSPEENELIVNKLLKKYRDQVELVEIPQSWPNAMPGLTAYNGKELNPELRKTLRILPNGEMDGFYCAKLIKL